MNANPQFLASQLATRSLPPTPRTSMRPRSSRCRIRARSTCRARAPTSACRCARSRQADTPASASAREKNPPHLRLRHLRPLHRPGGEDRHPLRAAAAARRLDRGARRHRSTGRARRPPTGSERLPIPSSRRLRFDLQAHAAPRQAGHERHADALRAPRHRHAGDGIHRDPREPAPRDGAFRD